MYKLRDYAKKHDITYRTAYSHFKAGLIEGSYQLPTGTIVIPDSSRSTQRPDYTIIYTRVSSTINKDNLESQAKRLVEYCNARGWGVNEVVKEIGSGLNENRPKLLAILSKRVATRIVVEHKDRLARFGIEYINKCCEAFNCQLHIVNQVDTDEEDIIQDFVSVITSFCARIYGKRRSKRKTERIIEELKND